ncbi:MAG: TRAP transporter permease [Nitrospirae bacterium]|nr:MAG: TRAP transporter permease [Nitrospirota bacterium]
MVESGKAESILKAESGEIRPLRRFEGILIGVVAIAWGVFQLSIASVLILDSTRTRAIHLAFAITLCFLLLPALKRELRRCSYLGIKKGIPLVDYLFAISGAVSALYIVLDYKGITMRAGMPLTRDIVFGLVLIVLLLEASRRVIGPALSIIAILFTAYAFLGPYLPDVFAFKGVSLRKYMSNITLSTEGIYGIPLGVSASIVYLFVLLGGLLDVAGAGRFFTNLALSVLGRYKGGPAKAAVVSSGASGLISGSSIANIVTTGPFTIPLMKKIGYPAKKAAAIEVAASTDGQLMPPIMGAAAFIIAEYVNVPYIEVVKAAAIPAFVSYFGLFCITHLEASKLGIRGLPPEDLPDLRKTLMSGLHYLVPIAVLVFELVILRHSPELSAFRAIIVLFGVIVYQEFRNKKGFAQGIKSALTLIARGMIQGAKNMISVGLACAAAGIIVGVVNMGIGGMITQIVEYISGGNIFLLLLITAIASMLLGMGLPTTATYIVMASLTAPIIVSIGGLYGFIIPLMAAHLFCFYFGILADDTPPVGLAAYTASAIARSEPIPTGIQGFLYDIRTSVIAFMFVFNPDLILHNIHSLPQGLMIFLMAMIGISAFECFAQNWCLTKNRIYDIPFFLTAAFILFHPGAMAGILGIPEEKKYLLYPVGITVYIVVILIQLARKKREPDRTTG